MIKIMITSVCLIFCFCIGCSHTPGDAALRGGHPEAAADLYLKGAEQGRADAALKLGLLLEDGVLSAPKYGTAAQWYIRACDLSEPAGCHNTGVAYEYGNYGVAKDISKAYIYYLKAAERGFMQAQYNLSSLYSNQYIQPGNDIEGYKWMLLAQSAAHKCKSVPLCGWILQDPPGHKAKLKSRMTDDQIKQAEELAAAWTTKK
jgi:hypothetical protein